MNNKTLLTTLIVSASVSFVSTLLFYALFVGYVRPGLGTLTCVLPAVGTYVVVKLTTVVLTRRAVVLIYLSQLALCVLIQAYGRVIAT